MANVSKLLFTTTKPECFLNALQLDDSDHALLRGARKKIRQHLRKVFAEPSQTKLGVLIAPRFFTQGSYSYKTINDPAHVPPQQMDMDDGCYLPMTFVKESAKPSQAASMFFELVDGALRDLAKREGWLFAEKPTCARVVLNIRAHVDVPLYAIPDNQFHQLEEAAALNARIAADFATRTRASVDRWEALPSDCVLLAHREKDWISSDPRKIADWFGDATDVYGEILRRVCRYLKAWRDFHAPHLDSLSSIILMVCAWNAFEELGSPNVPGRDDLALLKVAERLPRLLAGEIENPADPSERLDGRLDDEARRNAVTAAEQLARTLAEVVEKCVVPAKAIDGLTAAFGDRIPNCPESVSITETAYAEVHKHPQKIVPAPIVGRSTSG